jgi:hypothetical protein
MSENRPVPKILVISWSDLSKDARVTRQIHALSELYRVDTLAYSACAGASGNGFLISEKIATGFHRLLRRFWLITRQFERYYWSTPAVVSALRLIENHDYDLIVANDIDALPFALWVAKPSNTPVFFDAHEFSPAEFEEKLIFRLAVRPYKNYLCKKYVREASAMTTVSPGLAKRYKADFEVDAKVVLNAPAYHEAPFKTAEMDVGRIRLVHHGVANRTRGIHHMIEAVIAAGEKFSLDLYLVKTDSKYFDHLVQYERISSNIKIHPPVALDQIVSTLASYDVGLCVFPASSFNQRYCLPNKFFDFIQARLPVIVGPLPDMQFFTSKYDLGWIIDDYSALAIKNQLTQITKAQILQKSKNLEAGARELSYDSSRIMILGLARDLINKSSPRMH